MRSAEAREVWRKLQGRGQNGLAFRTVGFEGVNGLGTGSVSLAGLITAVCGSNGAGKTTLLQSLHHVLAVAVGSEKLPGLPHKVSQGSITIDFGDSGVLTYDIRSGSIQDASEANIAALADLRLVFLDPSSDATFLRAAFRRDADIEGLLEGAAQNTLDSAQLATVNRITGKSYSSVDIFEIEPFATDEEGEEVSHICDDVLPYFRVTLGTVAYDTRGMGLGELSLLVLYWAVARAGKNDIMLIEEPEQFVSPRSQRNFMDYLAQQCFDQGITALVTTHSADVLSSFSFRDIRVAVPWNESVDFQEANASARHLHHLGVSTRIRGLIFVEDVAAKAFLEGLLDKYCPHILNDFNVVYRQGVSGVLGTLRALPTDGHSLRFCGVLDGDQRQANPSAEDWPLLFLPGEGDPEQELRAAAHSAPDVMANRIGLDADQVKSLLAPIAGEEIHDWLMALCGQLGLTTSQLVRHLLACWLMDEDNVQSARGLVGQLYSELFE